MGDLAWRTLAWGRTSEILAKLACAADAKIFPFRRRENARLILRQWAGESAVQIAEHL
jgi:hypothetical protein